ncbi:related to ph-regulated antigen pra1 precursor [Moesziomyces antarcticus]|uniref:Related to ph-regulated antigen pra1 n=1 Tax=Pseudozyma antarctica TaxID=84753 RepID=A0A5C3FPE1_PSEA2|nr:related to ph-regulated antigen pra1 precursor [Moesziomyces antarcticus]
MQIQASFGALLALVSTACAMPTFLQARSVQAEEKMDAVWRIHESCNGTQRAQIQRGVDDMHKLASSSIAHLVNHPRDAFFTKYFGEEGDPASVIGYFEQLISGDKGGALLRCDNPDGNCRFADWNGHWRGNNATAETVICDLSYQTRRPLEQVCGFGFQLARDSPSTYFGADLLHRAFHVPQFVNEKIHHYADTYADCLELAKTNASAAVTNQYSLQYFAVDVYSRNMVKNGCVGKVEDKHDHSHATTSAAAPAQTQAQTSSSAAPSATAPAASADCHTHADGSVHCGTH